MSARRYRCEVLGCLFTCEWPGELAKHMRVHDDVDEVAPPEVAREWLERIRAILNREPEPARASPLSEEQLLELLRAA